MSERVQIANGCFAATNVDGIVFTQPANLALIPIERFSHSNDKTVFSCLIAPVCRGKFGTVFP